MMSLALECSDTETNINTININFYTKYWKELFKLFWGFRLQPQNITIKAKVETVLRHSLSLCLIMKLKLTVKLIKNEWETYCVD